MAAANPGGPVRNPGQGAPSTPGGSNGYNPATAATETLDNYFNNHFPHSSDHGRNIFNHISTNRGASPGTLNGAPAANPGRGTTPIRHAKNPNPGGLSTSAPGSEGSAGRTRGTTPFPGPGVQTETGRSKAPQRPVDITVPPTLTGDTSGNPGQRRAGY